MDRAEPARQRFALDALHVFALCGFAVAQPVYDLIGQNAEFFVAHRLGPAGILAFVAALSLGLPALLVLVEALALRLGPAVQRIVHVVLVFALATAFLAPLLNRASALPGYAPLGAAVVLGALATALYVRSGPVRSFVTVLSPGIVAFPVLFLLFTPVSSLLAPRAADASGRVAVRNPVPIVLIILDEFEAGSLLDENKDIDAVRFPNFAGLARDGWWFPHATTAWPETKRAVPAILTGLSPKEPKAVPTLQSQPNNLFTWLRGAYRFNAAETLTSLCPEDLCAAADPGERTGFDGRLFLSDLSVIYLHVILPPAVAQTRLPAMDTGWKGFTKPGHDGHDDAPAAAGKRADKRISAYRDRGDRFSAFIEGIRRGEANTLHFLHILLPHVKYTYLPSGANYQGDDTEGLLDKGLPDRVWTDDELLPALAYQRFLLQVGFVDTLVGRLVQRLKSEGLYDSALVIITSDHGKSFRPGQPKRLLTAENASDVLQVPLFVKLPGQSGGQRIERPVSTVDILPTIAQVIGADVPWQTDGRSLVDPSSPNRETIELRALDHLREPMRFAAADLTSYPRLRWKLETFGSRTPLARTAITARHSELLGAPISALTVTEAEPELTFASEQVGLFADVQPGSGVLPAHLRGEILGLPPGPPLEIAVAVNGRIEVVTRTTAWTNKPHYVSAMIPEPAFQPGPNALEVFKIRQAGGKVVLSPIPLPAQHEFKLARDEAGQETLVASTGQALPLRQDAVKGYLDRISSPARLYQLTGWAVDAAKRKPAAAVVVFSEGKQVYSGRTGGSRPDLVKFFGAGSVLESGFRLTVPKAALTNPASLRIFGISEDGVAGELTIDDAVRSSLENS
ncbi:MAG TPA: sulfatase-like hydrolase/transferase [Microvirga sp.]|nr:sulfatase-like hydrolase/transferase [Microvirga sp.]